MTAFPNCTVKLSVEVVAVYNAPGAGKFSQNISGSDPIGFVRIGTFDLNHVKAFTVQTLTQSGAVAVCDEYNCAARGFPALSQRQTTHQVASADLIAGVRSYNDCFSHHQPSSTAFCCTC